MTELDVYKKILKKYGFRSSGDFLWINDLRGWGFCNDLTEFRVYFYPETEEIYSFEKIKRYKDRYYNSDEYIILENLRKDLKKEMDNERREMKIDRLLNHKQNDI